MQTRKRETFPLLFTVFGLLFLVACRSAAEPTATEAVVPPPTSAPTVEITKLPDPTLGTDTVDSARAEELEQSAPSPQPSPLTPSPSPPVRGGEVVVGGLGHLDTLHPLLAETESGRALVPLLFDSMLTYDAFSGQLTPHLAEDWLMATDSRTITFTLRADAHWHDGLPVVADDVVFSIEAARDPALDSLYGPPLEPVLEVSALDDRTVVVRLGTPHCPMLATLGELPILPQHVLAGSDLDVTSFGSHPLGSGPFVFVERTADDEIRLARNEDYWGGVPYLDALRYRPFQAAADLQSALESKQIDAALMPPDFSPAITDSASLSVYHYPIPKLLFVAFNNDHPVLSDSRVRQALSAAVDRDALQDQVLGGAAELLAGSLPAAHWAADPALEPPAYDPDGARRLLAEAGWSDTDGDGWLDRDSERLRLPVRTNGGDKLREDVATLVASYYRALGVDASVELAVWGAVVDDLFTHDFEIIVFSWPLAAEPDQSRWWLSTENEIGSGYNVISFSDETVDRLLVEALNVPECDPDRRAEIYQQIQEVLAQERPYDFLFIPYATLLTRPDLLGIEAGPFAGPLESAAAWYLVR